MLPLHYRHSCSRDISGSACFIFFFESSARKSFDEFVGAYLLPAASYFCFPLSSDFKPGVSVPLASVNWLFGLVA